MIKGRSPFSAFNAYPQALQRFTINTTHATNLKGEPVITASALQPILATDLDGTFIPGDDLPADDPQWQALHLLQKLIAHQQLEVVFVTGRHLESVMEVMQHKDLPQPQWIICDVGTSIFHQDAVGSDQPYRPLQSYVNHLDQIVDSFSVSQLLSQLDLNDELILQEPEKQGRHKLSFYCKTWAIDDQVRRLELQLQKVGAPYRIVSSIDPFNGQGLIDLLPLGTDKASALLWWAEFRRHDARQIVFAGDSGNDFAALTAGFRAIVVGNADRQLAARVAAEHRQLGHPQRAYLAEAHATAGVLEGCRHFGLVPASSATF